MCRRRYSHIEGCRLLVGLGSAAATGSRGRRRLPAQGTIVKAHPLDRGATADDLGTATSTPDRGTAVTARRGQGRRRLHAQGTIVKVRPLDRGADDDDLGTATSTPDRGTAVTARRGRGAAATTATNRGSTTACAIGQPPSSHAPSLMNRDGTSKTEP
jgi:hypothetical protein